MFRLAWKNTFFLDFFNITKKKVLNLLLISLSLYSVCYHSWLFPSIIIGNQSSSYSMVMESVSNVADSITLRTVLRGSTLCILIYIRHNFLLFPMEVNLTYDCTQRVCYIATCECMATKNAVVLQLYLQRLCKLL